MRLITFLILCAAWYINIPGPDERRWETYCYPDAGQAETATILEAGGYDLTFVQYEEGQPGWWYLRGEGYSSESPCLLQHYFYQVDFDGDGAKDKAWPFAEFVSPETDHCCSMGGY